MHKTHTLTDRAVRFRSMLNDSTDPWTLRFERFAVLVRQPTCPSMMPTLQIVICKLSHDILKREGGAYKGTGA